jgi:hypothetical protein
MRKKKETHGFENIKVNIVFYFLTLCPMPHARGLLAPETL